MWRGAKVLMLFAALATVALMAAPGASPQGAGATQLVISGQTPPGTTINGNLDGFGIWVWCEDPDAGNLYAGACSGSMYFYDIELTKHVFGEVTNLDEGAGFSVDLASRDLSIVCTVTGNLPATRGPSNTIHVDCSRPAPGRAGDLTKTVVVVTNGS
jgi:hypothetical protein